MSLRSLALRPERRYIVEHKTSKGFPFSSTMADDPEKDEGTRLSIQVQSSRFFRLETPSELIRKVEEWTSVRTPVEGHVKTAMSGVEMDNSLHKGIHVVKISSFGKFRNRILTVSRDKFALFVTHSRIKNSALSTMGSKLPLPMFSRKGITGFRKKELREQYVRYIDVADLDGIQMGVVGTQKLEHCREKPRLKGFDSTIDKVKEQIVTIFHHGDQTLDILVPNPQERQLLVEALTRMRATYLQVMEHVVADARLLRYIWYDMDQNHDGNLSENEFARLLNRINLFVKDPKTIYLEFKGSEGLEADLSYRQCVDLLTCFRQGKIDKTQVSMPLIIFETIFGKVDYVDANTFLTKFLQEHQKELDATIADVEALFKAINVMELHRDESSLPIREGHLSKLRFVIFLNHSINNAYHPNALEMEGKLDKPMSQYWINTSHNTYLTGDQLQSTSSVQMYVNALRRGCKCLELDCWDGELSKEGTPIPVVFHGYTLTTKICFGDILDCVLAFVKANPDTYPVILSLESHCSRPYQQVIADLLMSKLGDYLYIPDAKDMAADLPSPESLKGKVVIKGKRPPEPDDAPVEELEPFEELEMEEDDPYSPSTEEDAKMDTKGNKKQKDGEKAPKSFKILPELAALTLFHGTKYRSFERSIESPKSHMHSIGETKITTILQADAANSNKWREYNAHHMTRTYPAGSRVDSSNYNPILAWAMGCQMVALNFQTSDSPLMLNDGMFLQNGGCGYVLKPPAVMGTAAPRGAPTTLLRIRVLSGTCLPKPNGDTVGETIDPYVQVTVHDVVVGSESSKEDYKSSSYSTLIINDNGFNPMWNESVFHEFEIQFPQVAMVQIALQESDVTLDEKIASASIPFSCLRRGYRSIQLHDLNGTRTGPFSMATILVEIDY